MIARYCPVCNEKVERNDAAVEFGTEIEGYLKYNDETVYYCSHCGQYFFEEDFYFTETET